jgi:hypothetical protein
MTRAAPRGTTNRNARGSAADRRLRKQWLLDSFGDGESAKCELRVSPRCAVTVDFVTITVDRWPTAGCDGGTYSRENIRPACGSCNSVDGGRTGARRRREQRR